MPMIMVVMTMLVAVVTKMEKVMMMAVMLTVVVMEKVHSFGGLVTVVVCGGSGGCYGGSNDAGCNVLAILVLMVPWR